MKNMENRSINSLLFYYISGSFRQHSFQSRAITITQTAYFDRIALNYIFDANQNMMRPRLVISLSRILFAFSSKKNHYEVLQSTPWASQQELKRHYYSLVKRYHPDVSKVNQQHIKAINQAYSILSDQNLRKKYDREQGFIKTKLDSQQDHLRGKEASRDQAPRRRRPYYDQQRQMFKSKRRYRYEGSSQKYLQDFMLGLAFTGLILLLVSLPQKRQGDAQQPPSKPFRKQDFQRQFQASLMRRPSQQFMSNT